MHADDTNYTLVKNGVVVVSGTGPAIRVDGRSAGHSRWPPRDSAARSDPSGSLQKATACCRLRACGRFRHLRCLAMVARYRGGFHPTRLGWKPHNRFRSAGSRSTRSAPDASSRLQRRHTEGGRGHHSRNPAGQIERTGCSRGPHGIGGCEHEDQQARCGDRARDGWKQAAAGGSSRGNHILGDVERRACQVCTPQPTAPWAQWPMAPWPG